MEELKQNWKNRIVGHADMDPKTLVPNPDNWRLHPKNQQESMEGALDDIGWVAGITVNKNTGLVVDGHLRLDLALRRKEPLVPVTFVDLSPEEEAAVLATLDPISSMAKTDKAKLKAILTIAKSQSQKMQDLLETMRMRAGSITNSKWKGEDFKYEKIDTDIEVGQLYRLGRHKVICGDCTTPAICEKLMAKEVASILFTSPPYNLGIGIEEVKAGKTSKYKEDEDIAGQKEYLGLLDRLNRQWLPMVCYSFINVQLVSGNKLALLEWLYNWRNNFADMIVWDKGHAPPAMTENVMNSQFELIAIFKEDQPANRRVGTKKFRGVLPNVYSAPPQRNNDYSGIHNATFPVHLPLYIISSFTNTGDSVCDPFLGTGTTLVACEETGRTCYGVELEPEYCEISIQRWEKMTGQKRELL
jgi:DNA modification methylase